MVTSVIARQLQNALLTFSFRSYNHYGNACYSLKVIIVVTKILATILAIPGYSQSVCQSWQLYSQLANQHSLKTPINQQTCLIAIASYTQQYLYNLPSFTCLHTYPFVQKDLLFSGFCVMNMITHVILINSHCRNEVATMGYLTSNYFYCFQV